MAFSFHPLDAALDSLGINYTDGVTVQIAEKYTINCDLEDVENLVKHLEPQVLSLEAEYDCSYEKGVLEDLLKYQEDKAAHEADRRRRIEEFDQRKAEEVERRRKEEEERAERRRKEEEERALEDERRMLEEIEREKVKLREVSRLAREKDEEEERRRREEEERKEGEISHEEEEKEWRRFEEERRSTESSSKSQEPEVEIQTANSQSCDKSNPTEEEGGSEATQPLPVPGEDGVSAPGGGALSVLPDRGVLSAPPEQTPPVIMNTAVPTQDKHYKNVKINFSDFEAVADVFADMELKTINDYAELQSILGADSNRAGSSQQAGSIPGNNRVPGSIGGVGSNPAMNGFYPGYSNPVIARSLQYQSSQQYQAPVSGQGYSSQSFPSPNPTYPAPQTGSEGALRYPAVPPVKGAPVNPPHPSGYSANPFNYLTNGNEAGYASYYQGYSGFGGVYPPGGGAQNQFFNPYKANPAQQASTGGVETGGSHVTSVQSSARVQGGTSVQGGDSVKGGASAGTSLPGVPGKHPVSRTKSEDSQARSRSSDRTETNQHQSTYAKLSSGERSAHSTAAADCKPETSELKPSRSVGDLLSELQHEARSIAAHKRKTVQTPPPRPVSRGGPSGLEDWVPWPQIGGEEEPRADRGLEGLGAEERRMCLQLAEMGFPLHRLTSAARCYGADSQKLLNYCVLVDKLVEEGGEEQSVLDTVLLHESNEAASRKHIAGFRQLCELGFQPHQSIHKALIDTGQDYQKALDQLLNLQS